MAALPRLLREMLALPTAAFVETAISDYVRGACDRLKHVSLRRDRHGNLLVRYRHRPPRRTPLVFCAHMDHPGFVALRMAKPGRLRAAFRGWVEPEYFKNQAVRFWHEGRWVRGDIRRITRVARIYRMIGRTARPEEVEIEVPEPIAANAPGMWDLPDPELRDGRVYARGCDDVAGCAAMLALLERLSRKSAAADVYCFFTRAEEVGFVGALAACESGTMPRRLPVISIETSKALPTAQVGAGPVLRVGDKSSVFTPELTAFCDRVAAELAQRRARTFAYQRRLMDGGTCEATAFHAFGYAATGICVPLGNYHNMNTDTRRIDSEYVSLADWERMVDWFEALTLDRDGYRTGAHPHRAGLEKRLAEWRHLL